MSRLLLVGLDNPQSRDPRHALFPYPPGCTGHRLWKMMRDQDEHFSRQMYHNISKTNLFPTGPVPTDKSFHRVAGDLLRVQLEGQNQRAVLLGAVVRDSVLATQVQEMPDAMQFVIVQDAWYAWIPHPSGRNRDYNVPAYREKVGRWLLKEARRE